MTQEALILGLVIAGALQAPATEAGTRAAPPGTAETRYCMHVGPVTGSLAETTECWTRDQWADQGVDVDQEWAREGVRTIG